MRVTYGQPLTSPVCQVPACQVAACPEMVCSCAVQHTHQRGSYVPAAPSTTALTCQGALAKHESGLTGTKPRTPPLSRKPHTAAEARQTSSSVRCMLRTRNAQRYKRACDTCNSPLSPHHSLATRALASSRHSSQRPQSLSCQALSCARRVYQLHVCQAQFVTRLWHVRHWPHEEAETLKQPHNKDAQAFPALESAGGGQRQSHRTAFNASRLRQGLVSGQHYSGLAADP